MVPRQEGKSMTSIRDMLVRWQDELQVEINKLPDDTQQSMMTARHREFLRKIRAREATTLSDIANV